MLATRDVIKNHIDQNIPVEVTQARITSQIQKAKSDLSKTQLNLRRAETTHL